MKVKLLTILVGLFLFIGFGGAVFGADETVTVPPPAPKKVTVYFFWQFGCPHCEKGVEFLEKLKYNDPYVEIKSYEVSKDTKNAAFLQLVGKKLNTGVGGVPFTVVGSTGIPGFLSVDTTGNLILMAIKNVKLGNDTDVVGSLLTGTPKLEEENRLENEEATTRVIPETLDLPLLGEINTKKLSLPALAIVIGFLDGFNPCAMWVLIFLISLLLGMKDRKRMWILGSTFIAASTLVYFLFMVAWLNLFLCLGFVFAIRIIIGLFAAGVGIYNIRDFVVNKEAACKVTGNEGRRKILEKLKLISQRQELWLALGGIILLAFAVNLNEAVCSAGLPAIFTQVLALSDLPRWQYYAYILLYLLVFMLDDLVVFALAMITLRSIGINTKYTRYSHLVGGIVMLVIGIIMLFRPELLMFG